MQTDRVTADARSRLFHVLFILSFAILRKFSNSEFQACLLIFSYSAFCILPSYTSLSADYIQPRCMDDDPGFLRCDSGRLTFNEALAFQSINITQYEQINGRYTNYRPIYRASVPGSSSTKVYLYHADGNWRLGLDYTRSTSAFGRVNDTALRPEFIIGTWQIHYKLGWSRWNAKLRCKGTCYCH